ncbi:hypothetical protein Patl1_19833 [Pistacia atlantica]|uniref:Uncharacterized protein n=1 Tax=Pistacia atlantica TaxID=434234 RepID=A0ACC1BHY5_9ROSI|nr:hypothetical protein Patl1_19833 [Pistacia atlantica]
MVETVATLSRCVTMYILIVKQVDMEKEIVFALSQVAYGACLFLGYWGYFLLSRAFRTSELFPFRELSGENGVSSFRRKFICYICQDQYCLLRISWEGLIFMAFGPSYSYSLIRLLYGQNWSDGEASLALKYYCLYIIVLAMNGTSEAFLHAVATEDQIKRSNDSLLVFSVIYIITNVLLIQSAGAVGLILANSINMSLRIIYSAVFIKHYFQDSFLVFLPPLLAFRLGDSVVFRCNYSPF